MPFLVLHEDQSHTTLVISINIFFFQEATIPPLHLLPEVFIAMLSDRKHSTVEAGLPPVLVLPHHHSTFQQWYSWSPQPTQSEI